MEIKTFPDFEKLGLDGSVDSLKILRDLNNSTMMICWGRPIKL